MKKYIFILFSVLFFACKTQKNENQISENEEPQIPVLNFSYIQSADTTANKKILIVVIDPKGDGTTAIKKFSKVVEKYECTIIGLNDVRNGQQDYVDRISNDVKSAILNLNLHIEKVFFVGFSGGARMSYAYSSVIYLNGLILCGAGAPIEELAKAKFPVAMLIGTKDFNFMEHYYSPYSEYVTNFNLLTLMFNGKHEWPSEQNLMKAIDFVFNRNGIKSNDSIFDYNSDFDFFVNQKNYLLAAKTLEAAYKMASTENQITIKQKYNSFIARNDVKKYFNKLESLLNEEINRNSQYITNLQVQNNDWWTNELKNLKNYTNSSDSITSDSYSRTIAYMGVALYSLTKKELTNPQSSNIDKYLMVYETFEPQNPDMIFFKAVREKQKGNTELSQNLMQKAVELGFSDKQTAQQFGM